MSVCFKIMMDENGLQVTLEKAAESLTATDYSSETATLYWTAVSLATLTADIY